MKIAANCSKLRAKQNGSSISEFGPVLFILFGVILFPLLDFLTFADGAATLSFAAQAAARSAGPAATRRQAKQNMLTTGTQFIGNGTTPGPLAAFAKLTPFDNSGLTLSVLEVANNGSITSTFTDASLIPAADLTAGTNFFQYQVTASYQVGLMWPIPFLPKSSPMTFKSTIMVEHPEGLNSI